MVSRNLKEELGQFLFQTPRPKDRLSAKAEMPGKVYVCTNPDENEIPARSKEERLFPTAFMLPDAHAKFGFVMLSGLQ